MKKKKHLTYQWVTVYCLPLIRFGKRWTWSNGLPGATCHKTSPWYERCRRKQGKQWIWEVSCGTTGHTSVERIPKASDPLPHWLLNDVCHKWCRHLIFTTTPFPPLNLHPFTFFNSNPVLILPHKVSFSCSSSSMQKSYHEVALKASCTLRIKPQGIHSLVLIVSKRNEIQNIFLVKYQDVLIFLLASQKEESCQDLNVQCGKSLRKPSISRGPPDSAALAGGFLKKWQRQMATN